MHDYLPEEVLGKKFYTFLAPASRENVIEIYRKSVENEPSPVFFEYMRLNRDGGVFPTEIRANVAAYDGQLSNIGICRDITERVENGRESQGIGTDGLYRPDHHITFPRDSKSPVGCQDESSNTGEKSGHKRE